MKDFLGKDGFVWFVGVVEDRDDPDQLGRLRVRCLGWHTDDRAELEHTNLPWATVMQPTDTPGTVPNTALVEGTWVVGFFQDADKGQHPIIMGSLPGFHLEKPNFSKGFSDPKKKYPISEGGEPDTSRLARGSIAETHPSLQQRRSMKQTKVPKAKKPHLSQTDADSTDEERTTWDEEDPRQNTSSRYPFNHVREFESGIVYEDDDTPGAVRILRQHPTGTFEEIEPKGDRVLKVIGKSYEIVMKDNNVLISGDLNVTVQGTKRELIKGDYVLEVEGDYTQNIGKNQRTKIGYINGGNKYEEILGNWAFNINDNVRGRVEDDVDVMIGGNQSYKINGENKIQVQKDFTTIVGNDILTNAKNNMAVSTTSGIMSHKSGSKLNMKSAATMTIKSESTTDWTSVGLVTETFQASHTNNTTGTFDLNVSTEVDVDSGIINLN